MIRPLAQKILEAEKQCLAEQPYTKRARAADTEFEKTAEPLEKTQIALTKYEEMMGKAIQKKANAPVWAKKGLGGTQRRSI